MQQILDNSDETVYFAVLQQPWLFETPFKDQDYAVLLVVNDDSIAPDEQFKLSHQLVASGCRYAVCFGYECSTWDDSIDYAYLEGDPNFDPRDDRFVMTTWHEDESIEDVVEFFRLSTSFDDFVPRNFLLLFLGEANDIQNRALKTIRDCSPDTVPLSTAVQS